MQRRSAESQMASLSEHLSACKVHPNVCIYIYMLIHIYISIYIYTCREGGRERERDRRQTETDKESEIDSYCLRKDPTMRVIIKAAQPGIKNSLCKDS